MYDICPLSGVGIGVLMNPIRTRVASCFGRMFVALGHLKQPHVKGHGSP